MSRYLFVAVLTLGLVSPALGEERADEIAKFGKLECLVKHQGRGGGVNPIRLAEEMGIDVEEICACDGRALAQMSMRGQDIFMKNYKEFNKRKHLPYPEDDLNKRATYIIQHCPNYFAFEEGIKGQREKNNEGMWMRVTVGGVTHTWVVRDGKVVKVPDPSQSD